MLKRIKNPYLSETHYSFKKDILSTIQNFDDILENDNFNPKSFKKLFGVLSQKNLLPPFPSNLTYDFWHEIMVIEAVASLKNSSFGMAIATNYFIVKYVLTNHVDQYSKGHIFSLALTEEQAGSDLRGIQTRAIKIDNKFILNGKKMYITNAPFADSICVLAKTQNNNAITDFTLFLVPRNIYGLNIEQQHSLGNIGATGIVNMSNVSLEEKNVIGSEGKGLLILLTCLKFERLIISIKAIAQSWEIFYKVIQWCNNRQINDEILINKPLIRFKITDIWNELSATTVYVQDSIEKICNNKNNTNVADVESAQSKLLSTEILNEISDLYVQVMGANGYLKNAFAAKTYLDTPALNIAGGSSEMLLEIIANGLRNGKNI